nr:nucleotidyltransferase domain-containing protein [Streptomyces sp. SBT349]
MRGVPELPDLGPVVREQPYPLLFATVSGAHLYGFPSRDSDVDLRGVHLLPLREVVGLTPGPETVARSWVREGVEMDLVTHDLTKFARMLLRPNGYVLEQLLSPLIAHSTPVHAGLVALAPRLLARHHARHYRGFARTQTGLFEKTGELKPLLYAFRVLMTGVHLMRERELQADLPSLLAAGGAPTYVPRLVAAKAAAEHGLLSEVEDTPPVSRILADLGTLHATLDTAEERTTLPADPADASAALNDLVLTARLG